jgi:hypothetical protein
MASLLRRVSPALLVQRRAAEPLHGTGGSNRTASSWPYREKHERWRDGRLGCPYTRTDRNGAARPGAAPGTGAGAG